MVRVSGPGALPIARKIFRPKKSLGWDGLTGYTMLYGKFIEAAADNRAAPASTAGGAVPASTAGGECVCLIFKAPKSYTGEDVIEFQCHGGPAVMRQALEAVLAAGARPAQPGEFTKRAYLNGRIDLTRAEAVMQLISAGSAQAARAANAALGGALSTRMREIREGLVTLLGHISAWVDYPEEDIPALEGEALAQVLSLAAAQLRALLARAPRDQRMLGGLSAALVGKPNVGKSSLMNLLAGYERSIVAELPGTTRDTVTETASLGALTLRLTDTAGLREAAGEVERAGVERSRAALGQSDLLLAVCDGSAPLEEEDHALFAACDPARTILIRNKCDLGIAWDSPGQFICVDMSALLGQGADALAAAAEALMGTGDFSPNEAILANRRQCDCARAALSALEEAARAQADGFPLDAVAVCVEDAVQALYALTGERAADAVVDEVFSRFCVGK